MASWAGCDNRQLQSCVCNRVFNVLCILPAQIRVFGKTASDDSFEVRRYLWREVTNACRFFLQDRGDQTGRRLSLKSASAGEHFVDDAAQGEDVLSLIHISEPTRLLSIS